MRNSCIIFLENLEGSDALEELDIDGRISLIQR